MRVRYTITAAHELDRAIEYLTEHAQSIVGEFVSAIEQGVKEIVEFPFSAQATEKKGVRRKYIRRFRYSVTRSKATKSLFFTSGTLPSGCRGRTNHGDNVRHRMQ